MYCNFRPFTHAVDNIRIGHFLQQQEKNFNRLPALAADSLHPKKKFFHTYCFWSSIEW